MNETMLITLREGRKMKGGNKKKEMGILEN